MIPLEFKTGYRALLLLHRNKDGGLGNIQRKGRKVISPNPDIWDKTYAHFKELQQTTHSNCRFYASVNERSMSKAIREFKRLQLDHDYEREELRDAFYIDAHNRFFSCFMQPAMAVNKKFLIDCDTEFEIDLATSLLKNKIIHSYPTPNGMHLITKPFNPFDYPAISHLIHKDGLLYVQ